MKVSSPLLVQLHRAINTVPQTVRAALLIAGVTVAVWARPVLPGFGHLRLSNPGDSNSFEFYLAWNLHALAHGKNPFFTNALYAPDGLDLGNAISIPAVSLLVAPITATFGPTAAYNVAFLTAVFAAAFAVFLLGREITGSAAGGMIAGLLVVVSPYQAGHALGHLNMMWVAGLPLATYLVLRFIRGKLRGPGLAVSVGLIIAFTIGASTELFVTQCVFAAFALLIALAVSETRKHVLRSVPWLMAGGVLGVVLGLPVILAALDAGVPGAPANPPWMYSTDLTNIFAPSDVTLVGDSFFSAVRMTWLGNSAENTSYIPVPLLALAVAALSFAKGRWTAGLAVFAAIAVVLSFGPYLHIAGKRTIHMPWGLTSELPGLDHALPVRFSAFTFMALALLTAVLWRSATRWRLPIAIAAVSGFVLALPDVNHLGMPVDTRLPAYVSSGELRHDVHAGENILVLPPGQWGPGMRWVSEADFKFVTPTGNGGGAKAPVALHDPTGSALFFQDFDYPWADQLPGYLRRLGVHTVVVDAAATQWLGVAENTFPGQGTLKGGVWVYTINHSSDPLDTGAGVVTHEPEPRL